MQTRDRLAKRRTLAFVLGFTGVLALTACSDSPVKVPGTTDAGNGTEDSLTPEEESGKDFLGWPQFGRTPRHTSYNAFEKRITPQNVSELADLWSCCNERGNNPLVLQVIVWRGKLYVTNPGADSNSSPVVRALDAVTGDLLWEAAETDAGTLGGALGVPAAGYSRLFVHDQTQFATLSANNGKVVKGPVDIAVDQAMSYPVAARRLLFLERPSVLTTYQETGELAWEFPISQTAGSARVPRQPAVANDRVWTVAGERRLQALDTTGGKVLWQTEQVGGTLGSAAISEGRVFAMSLPSTLHAFDEHTGGTLWSASFEGEASQDGSPPLPPAVDNTGVYVASSTAGGVTRLSAFEIATGDPRLAVNVAQMTMSAHPTLGSGLIYLGAENGKLYVLGAADGDVLTEFDVGSAVTSIVTYCGRVYVGTDKGVFAKGLPGAQETCAEEAE